MQNADLKQALLRRIDAIESDEELLHVAEAIGDALRAPRPTPTMAREDAASIFGAQANSETDDVRDTDHDEVLGYRPNGEAVTLRGAVSDWEAGLEEVLNGGGHSTEAVLEFLAKRRRS